MIARAIAQDGVMLLRGHPLAGLFSPQGFGADTPVRAGYCWVKATSTTAGYWVREPVGGCPPDQQPPPNTPVPVVRDQRSTATTPSSGGGVTVTESNTMRTRRAQFAVKLQEFLTPQAALNKEIIAQIPPCNEPLNVSKSPWVTDYIVRATSGKTGWAYDAFHSPADLAKWAAGLDVSDLLRLNPALWQRLLIPGSFAVFGVPFALSERTEAKYSKSFVPSALQKWLIEFQIVLASNSGDTISDDIRKLKVADALPKLHSKGLRYEVSVPGFGLNPEPPLATETLDAYLSRGGYLIDLDRVQGKKRIGVVPNGRLACSTFCTDATGLPYCTELVNLSGDSDNVSGWEAYVTAPQPAQQFGETLPMTFVAKMSAIQAGSAAPSAVTQAMATVIEPTYTITLKYKEYDPSWWQTAANAVGSVMTKFHKELCTPGTTTNAVASKAISTTQEKSSDPFVKAWATGMQYTLGKCAGTYTPSTIAPVAPVTPETPAAAPTEVTPLVPVSTAPAMYQGCVSRYHKRRRTFSVYCPLDWKPSGFGADVSPPPPTGTTKVAELPEAPPEAPNVGAEDDPFYKKWWFWTAIGGAAVAGGTGYALVRRRRR